MVQGKYFDRTQSKIINRDEGLSHFIMEHAVYFWMHMHILNRRGSRKRKQITSRGDRGGAISYVRGLKTLTRPVFCAKIQ